jgi:hypothetical protein
MFNWQEIFLQLAQIKKPYQGIPDRAFRLAVEIVLVGDSISQSFRPTNGPLGRSHLTVVRLQAILIQSTTSFLSVGAYPSHLPEIGQEEKKSWQEALEGRATALGACIAPPPDQED